MLSDDAELVYRRALDVLWQANELQMPSNCLKLAKALARGWTTERFENAWSEIQSDGYELLKTTDDGSWVYSKRLKLEAEKIEKLCDIRRKAAKKGGMASAQAKGQPNAQAKAKANVNDSSSHTDTDINNNSSSRNSEGTEQAKLVDYLRGWIRKNNPKHKFNGPINRWDEEMDRMIRIDGRTVQDIREIIKWSQKDPFFL